jgi:hypothetical protein
MIGRTLAVAQTCQGKALGSADRSAAVDALSIEPLSETLDCFGTGLLPTAQVSLRLGSVHRHVGRVNTRLSWPATTSLSRVSGTRLTTREGRELNTAVPLGSARTLDVSIGIVICVW